MSREGAGWQGFAASVTGSQSAERIGGRSIRIPVVSLDAFLARGRR